MLRIISFSILITFCSNVFSQDLNSYKKLIEEDKFDELQQSLPFLISEYPNHPLVAYLKASFNTNGEEAINQFKSIILEHPNSLSSELSIMKIGEVLFSNGLYSQASEQLKLIPLLYPESSNIDRAVDLMKKSYTASGEMDSLTFYMNIFTEKYPQIDFNTYDYYNSKFVIQDTIKINIATKETVSISNSDEVEVIAKLGEKPWVVQIGAFGEKKNADILVNRLKSAGYNVEIFEKTDQVSLYLVQIVRFNTIENAINIGEKVNEQLGLDFRILQRN